MDMEIDEVEPVDLDMEVVQTGIVFFLNLKKKLVCVFQCVPISYNRIWNSLPGGIFYSLGSL